MVYLSHYRQKNVNCIGLNMIQVIMVLVGLLILLIVFLLREFDKESSYCDKCKNDGTGYMPKWVCTCKPK